MQITALYDEGGDLNTPQDGYFADTTVAANAQSSSVSYRLSKKKGKAGDILPVTANGASPTNSPTPSPCWRNELVTDAVTHCRVSHSHIKVELTLSSGELTLEVSDPDREGLPRPHDSTPEEEGGRGPALVAALADDWGCRQEPYAKCVWARFGLEGAHVPATL